MCRCVDLVLSTQCHIPEDDALHSHRCKNLKSYLLKLAPLPDRLSGLSIPVIQALPKQLSPEVKRPERQIVRHLVQKLRLYGAQSWLTPLSPNRGAYTQGQVSIRDLRCSLQAVRIIIIMVWNVTIQKKQSVHLYPVRILNGNKFDLTDAPCPMTYPWE
jgi:hypothetical protein